MKYKITNKKDLTSQIVESRKKPEIDETTHRVKRIREKVETITHNQRKRAERKIKILDDNGKEHQEGEIFESKTMSIEF